MKFITSENPFRMLTEINGKQIMLQDDNGSCTISKFKPSMSAKSKCETMWEGDTEDFVSDFKGMEEHGQMNIEKAFTNFLNK